MFLKSNHSLSLQAGDYTAEVRMDAINAENITNYLNQLKSLYDEYDFDNHPEAIYNLRTKWVCHWSLGLKGHFSEWKKESLISHFLLKTTDYSNWL